MRKKISLLTAILILLVANLHAQLYEFAMPFVQNSEQPEIFMMEPHYNPQNEITHYSLGDLIKVKYKMNEQNRPSNKIMYMWDKSDYVWENKHETNYKYDSNNRLIEVRDEQLYPIIKGRSVDYIKTTIGLKQIVYNTDNNTETISEFKNMPAVFASMGQSFNGYSDSLYSVRYMNKNGMPDSVISEKQYYYSDTSIFKSIYKYDKQNRNIFTELFVKQYNKWIPASNIITKYEKNSITYTQIGTYPSRKDLIEKYLIPDEEVAIEYEYNDGYDNDDDDDENYKFDEKQGIAYTIRFDKQNRIVSKLLKAGGKTILNTSYSYNAQGSTSVKHEQNLDSEILSSFGMMGGRISDELKHMKYTIDYDKNNCSNSVYYMTNKKDKLSKLAEMTNCYSAKGLLTSSSIIKYDERDGEFDEKELVEITYDTDSSGQKIYYRVYEEEDLTKLKNNPRKKVIFKNSNSAQNTYEETFQHDGEEWNPDDIDIYKFDENGYEIYYEKYTYNSYHKKMQPKFIITYTPDSLNRILGREEKNWDEDNNKWVNYERQVYTYNDNHDKTSTQKYSWNKDENYWAGEYRDSTVYCNEEEAKIKFHYKWLDDKRDWLFSQKIEYSPVPENNTTTYYKWENDKWNPTDQSIKKRKYNSHYRENIDSEWNTETNSWEIHYLSKLSYNDDGRAEEVYFWNDDLNLLEGETHISSKSIRTDTTFMTENIYSLWDYKKNDWNLAIRESDVFAENNNYKETIIEKYDQKSKEWIKWDKVIKTTTNDTVIQVNRFIWDKALGKWVDKTMHTFWHKADSDSHYKYEYYVFNSGSNKLEPAMCGEKTVYNDLEGMQYNKWNKKSQKWDPYYLSTGWWLYSDGYTWDTTKNKWVNKSDINDELYEADKESKASEAVEYKFNYEILVEKNKEEQLGKK